MLDNVGLQLLPILGWATKDEKKESLCIITGSGLSIDEPKPLVDSKRCHLGTSRGRIRHNHLTRHSKWKILATRKLTNEAKFKMYAHEVEFKMLVNIVLDFHFQRITFRVNVSFNINTWGVVPFWTATLKAVGNPETLLIASMPRDAGRLSSVANVSHCWRSVSPKAMSAGVGWYAGTRSHTAQKSQAFQKTMVIMDTWWDMLRENNGIHVTPRPH